MKLPKKLTNKLKLREETYSLRSLKTPSNLVDFSSNDYLGFAKSSAIFDKTHQFLVDKNIKQNGATGSRLLSGNHFLYEEVESFLSEFHQAESATIFNAGYDANIGFFSAVPQRGDIILYDEFIHASIRDGIQLSNAKAFKFRHNNLEDLEKRLLHYIRNDILNQDKKPEFYVVTEAVFSMDGDSPNLNEIVKICKKYNAFLIVDEAHAVGVFGKNGCGIVQELNIQNDVFARIITFGKALGCHGAAILGSKDLQIYLVNFARSFIYTTGLSPHSLATIQTAYNEMQKQPFDCAQGDNQNKEKLQKNILFFKSEIEKLGLKKLFIKSNSAIHCCVISGNEKVKSISQKLQEKGFEVKAILSPTVPLNQERLRFCLHSYNSKKEISEVLRLLSIFVKNKEVFVVLGAPNSSTGELSSISVERLDFCKKILKENSLILCTGGWGDHFNTAEKPHAFYTKNYLVKKGVSEKSFLEFALSKHTVDDAVKTKEILAKLSNIKLKIITSDYHLERVKLIFTEILSEYEMKFFGVKSTMEKKQYNDFVEHEKKAINGILKNGLYY